VSISCCPHVVLAVGPGDCAAVHPAATALPAPLAVDIQIVQAQAFAANAQLFGRISARRSSEVRSRVQGILLQRVYCGRQ
jgi:hypothetical protein